MAKEKGFMMKNRFGQEADIYLSVVIPVYQADQILRVLCERVVQSVRAITERYEIIFIDDGSTDDSWRIMNYLAEENSNVLSVRLSRNFGHHYAIAAGLDISQGQWTVVMDCDLQDRPEDIKNLLNVALPGYDIVLARRLQRNDFFIKRLCSKLFYFIFGLLSGYRLDYSVGAFRIMNRAAVNAICAMRESSRMFAGIVNWVGFKTGYVDVEHSSRYQGTSSYNMRKSLKLALDGIISFSNRPLYIFIAIGITMSMLALSYGIYLLFLYFFVHEFGISGWLSIITLNAFLGGLVLFNLGIIGIYIGRIYDETKRRPLYIIQSIYNSKQKDAEKAPPCNDLK